MKRNKRWMAYTTNLLTAMLGMPEQQVSSKDKKSIQKELTARQAERECNA